jgi:3-dehydroquinate dehydratase/shikimate dehydrogenase
MMIEDHKALAAKGAQLVELRLDYLSNPPDLGRLIPSRPTPVVITCRRPADQGRWKEDEDQRLRLLRSAIVMGVEYVDLEEDAAEKIRRYGSTKRIVSYHNFEKTPEDLSAIHARLAKLDPDIIKIATMANTPIDNIRMLKLIASSRIPTVGLCMGELGLISRVLNGKYGSPFTFATFSSDRAMAPGQLTFDDMRTIYRYDRINPRTQVYGVLGDPIAHSMSPQIHNAGFEKEGLDRVYLPLRVPSEVLAATLQSFQWLEIQGYSVTLPHKETVVAWAHKQTAAVKEIGAANTLFRSQAGEWWADNTDYNAALESIRLGLKTDDNEAQLGLLSGKRTLVLGAGGVSRAVASGLLRAGSVVAISNRTKSRADDLAKELGCQVIAWENRGTVFADIVVNCTSVGMHPEVDESPFEPNWLREGCLVFDTIYNPEQTLFIKQARERNCATVTGIEMFIRQAGKQFELFSGRPAPIEVMREVLRRAISPVRLN